MVNAVKVIHWCCEECAMDYDHKEEANECCKKLEENNGK